MEDETSRREPSAAQSGDAAPEDSRLPGWVAKLFSWVRRQVQGLTVGAVVTALALPFLVNYCTVREFQRPDVRVEGVLPIIVHGELEGPPVSEGGIPTRWPDNRLMFVFKLQNNGPTPSRLGVGLITGCASMPLDTAGHLFGQEMDGRNINEIYQEAEAKWGKARQKIATTGSARELYEVAAFSVGYVTIEMSLPIQFLWHTSQHLQSTVAVNGDCSRVEVNYDPSAYQLFETKRSGGHLVPVALHEDFNEGNLRIEVQAGNELLRVDPALVKPLKRVAARFWTDVHPSELYENPSGLYLPRDR